MYNYHTLRLMVILFWFQLIVLCHAGGLEGFNYCWFKTCEKGFFGTGRFWIYCDQGLWKFFQDKCLWRTLDIWKQSCWHLPGEFLLVLACTTIRRNLFCILVAVNMELTGMLVHKRTSWLRLSEVILSSMNCLLSFKLNQRYLGSLYRHQNRTNQILVHHQSWGEHLLSTNHGKRTLQNLLPTNSCYNFILQAPLTLKVGL